MILKKVLFIAMKRVDDFYNWLQFAKCNELWDLDARGQHSKGIWTLGTDVRGVMLFVVGVPYSTFA